MYGSSSGTPDWLIFRLGNACGECRASVAADCKPRFSRAFRLGTKLRKAEDRRVANVVSRAELECGAEDDAVLDSEAGPSDGVVAQGKPEGADPREYRST